MRACACPGVFSRLQARFAERLRDREHHHKTHGLGRVVVHERCEGCGTPWLLLLQPERRAPGDRRGSHQDDPEA